MVSLSRNGKSKAVEVQRVIAITFLPNPNNFPCVNHKDENPKNNQIENLEWCSYKYNNDYGSRKDKARLARLNHGKLSKPICQFDLDGNLIEEYPSCAEVNRRCGYDTGKINACALKRPHRLTAYGYVWRFKDDNCAAPS